MRQLHPWPKPVPGQTDDITDAEHLLGVAESMHADLPAGADKDAMYGLVTRAFECAVWRNHNG